MEQVLVRKVFRASTQFCRKLDLQTKPSNGNFKNSSFFIQSPQALRQGPDQ